MRTDTAADAGHWIGLTRSPIGLFKFAVGNQRYITACIGMRGAGHHAGKVGVQPIPVNLLVDKAFEHTGTYLTEGENARRPAWTAPPRGLLAEREIGRCVAGDSHRIGFALGAFVPAVTV